jgi:hypothetical protein
MQLEIRGRLADLHGLAYECHGIALERYGARSRHGDDSLSIQMEKLGRGRQFTGRTAR